MKTSRMIALFTVLGVLSLTACSKKSDDVTPASTQTQTPTPSQSTVGFKAKIDGKEYTPDFAYATNVVVAGEGYYTIYGLNSVTNDALAIALPSKSTEGTYTLNLTNMGALTYEKESYVTSNGLGTGTVTLTKKTATSLSGTFSFTAYDATGTKKRTITDGTFNVTIR